MSNQRNGFSQCKPVTRMLLSVVTAHMPETFWHEVQSMGILPRIEPTRQELLQLWLKRNGIQQGDIASALNTGKNTVSRWLRAETIPSWRHQQLQVFGIPQELLPTPLDIAPGPKRRSYPLVPRQPEMQAG